MQSPAPPGAGPVVGLTFDQSNISGAWALGRILGGEIHPLPFAQQLEDGAPDSAAVEEMFDAAFIADESKAFIDEETCDSPGRHSRVPPMRESLRQSQALRGPLDERTYEAKEELRPRRASA